MQASYAVKEAYEPSHTMDQRMSALEGKIETKEDNQKVHDWRGAVGGNRDPFSFSRVPLVQDQISSWSMY